MVAIIAGEQYNIIDATDFDKAAGVLFELSEYLGNTIEPMEAARHVAINDMHERFDTETEPSGYKWFTLTDDYISRRGADSPILDDTGTKIKKYEYPPGTLRREATKSSNFKVDSQSLWYSTDGLPPYWAAHQYGSKNMNVHGYTITPEFGFVKGKGMVQTGRRSAYGKDPSVAAGTPPRPFIGLSNEAEDEIRAIFDRWIDMGFDFAEETYVSEGGGLPHIGDIFHFRTGKAGTITSIAPGSHGRPQFRIGGKFGPMA